MKATIGSILINEALPEELRDYDRVWDKKTTTNVMNILAHKYPDKYKDVLIALHEICQDVEQGTPFQRCLWQPPPAS